MASLVSTSDRFQASYSIAIVKPCKREELSRWLLLALSGPVAQDFMRANVRASSQPDLGLADIREIPIPVPPPLEQRAIVDRVSELFNLANSVRDRVTAAETMVDRSVGAAVHSIFHASQNGANEASDVQTDEA